jgi:ubiquinol-cytochrome c reductase cytochrome b subunit
LGGVIGMLAAILVLFALPYIKTSYAVIPAIKSPLYNILFWLFIANFLILTFLGSQPAAAPFVICSKFFTLTYFTYLLFAIPFLG